MDNRILNQIYEIQTMSLKLRKNYTKMYVNFSNTKTETPIEYSENSYLFTIEPTDSLDEIKESIKKYFRKRGMPVADNRSSTALIIEWKK